MVEHHQHVNSDHVYSPARSRSSSQNANQLHVKGPLVQKKESLKNQFWLTRIVYLRYLAFIYLVAFFIAFHQNAALIGNNGLTPAKIFIDRYRERFPSNQAAFFAHPTIFWYIEPSTENIEALALIGGGISFVLLLGGHGSMIMLFLLWIGYLSIVNVGQTWYSFGWESQLLEVGFLSMFGVPLIGGWWTRLCSLIVGRRRSITTSGEEDEEEEEEDMRFPRWTRTPWILIWGNKWLLFRLMLGAGLIKIRGDQCWRDLTCMNYHYQTQPVPNPMSNYFHSSPEIFHQIETGANHVVELLGPWLLLIPERRCQMVGGIVQILFQIILIASGNLSFLNWLTILPAITCFDDYALQFLFSKSSCLRAIRSEGNYRSHTADLTKKDNEGDPLWDRLVAAYFHYRWTYASFVILVRRALSLVIGGLILYLSYPVIQNIFSPHQVMNASFDSFRIVNTYGAFGSVTKTRHEEQADLALSSKAKWIEFEFRCKPGNIDRKPCLISPYHFRIDWLMWFAAFQSYQQCPWLVHIAYKLLIGDLLANDLLDPTQGNPFYNKTMITSRNRSKEDMMRFQEKAPKHVRAVLYEYRYRNLFNENENEKDKTEGWEIGKYWKRKFVGIYMPAIDKDNPSVKHFLRSYGMVN